MNEINIFFDDATYKRVVVMDLDKFILILNNKNDWFIPIKTKNADTGADEVDLIINRSKVKYIEVV